MSDEPQKSQPVGFEFHYWFLIHNDNFLEILF